jgi:Uma2 family endonuclease
MTTVHTHSLIGLEMSGSLMTADEFDAAEDWDENYSYELINGVLVVTPPPGEGERGPNGLLDQLLRNYRDQHPQGKSLDYTLVEQTIVVKRGNRRRADRVIWAGLGRVPNVRREPPTIAIEFVSPGRRSRKRDYDAKRDEYIESGVSEYWIIDRFLRTMTVIENAPSGVKETIVNEGDIYCTPLLPGFELPLARLLAEADLLEQAIEDPGDSAHPNGD